MPGYLFGRSGGYDFGRFSISAAGFRGFFGHLVNFAGQLALFNYTEYTVRYCGCQTITNAISCYG
jgi:hypothetical protein